MKLLVLAIIIAAANAAKIIDPSTCTDYPCLVFNEEFDELDLDTWDQEITMTGGGNFEFEAYGNNRSVSYTKDGNLYIKPAITNKLLGFEETWLEDGERDIWGMNGRGDVCTGHLNFGCKKRASSTSDIINPIESARLRTLGTYSFKYGTFEIRAKMPRGDWLWPAVWLLPTNWRLGLWPASGEIDVIESRGNDDFGSTDELTNRAAGTTLHWGPYSSQNRFDLTTKPVYLANSASFADDFHTWKMVWNSTGFYFDLDGAEYYRIVPGKSFWEFGEFDTRAPGIFNPWESEGDMAPFNRDFYIILNLAVGGTTGFFPDDTGSPKPWTNVDDTPAKNFWNDRDNWLQTWDYNNVTGVVGEGSALVIDYIKVYKDEDQV